MSNVLGTLRRCNLLNLDKCFVSFSNSQLESIGQPQKLQREADAVFIVAAAGRGNG